MGKRDMGEDRPMEGSGCTLTFFDAAGKAYKTRPAQRWRMDQMLFKQPPPLSGCGVWVALTPACIDELESAYARRIMDTHESSKAVKTLLEIRAELKKDPHLHWRIKQNLLFNIRDYLRIERRRFAK